MATVYKQSFAAFYLPAPPGVFVPPIGDYRRFPVGALGRISTEIVLDIRQAIDRRALALEISREENEKPAEFTARTSVRHDPEEVGDGVRGQMGISLREQQQWTESRVAFVRWRERIESLGVLVFQSKAIQLADMRGYSIAEFPLPIIVVNRKDAPSGRVFSMFHEFVHLMLRQGGLCDLDIGPDRPPEKQSTEVFCNHVAGAALVPRDYLLAEPIVRAHTGVAWGDDELRDLARRFAVSREVILRRLLILGLTSETFYIAKREQFLRQYESLPRRKGFVPPYRDLVSTAGKPFVRLVLTAFHDNLITTSDACDYLGVKTKHFDKVGEEVGF